MQQEFAGAVWTGGPALRRGQNPVNGVVDFLHELRSRAGTALAIPARSLFSLFDRSGMENEKRSLAHSAAEESFRRNVSRDTGLTLPESSLQCGGRFLRSRRLPRLSGSSWAPSRLSSREPANSARSSSLRARARFNSSVASCVMRSLYAQSRDNAKRDSGYGGGDSRFKIQDSRAGGRPVSGARCRVSGGTTGIRYAVFGIR